MYGSGHVLMTGTHPEVRNGSNVDWMTWDNYVPGAGTPWVNKANPWLFFKAALDNWLAAKPTVTAKVVPASWSNRAVAVTLTAGDTGGPGIAKIQYRLGGSSTWLGATVVDTTHWRFVVAASPDHSNDGTHVYECRALDSAGVASSIITHTVKIDTAGPTIAGKAVKGRVGYAVSLNYRITDKLSPKATAVTLTVKSAKGKLIKRFALGAKATKVWLSVKWTPAVKGVYRYSITAKDLAGNKQSKTGSVKITVSL